MEKSRELEYARRKETFKKTQEKKWNAIIDLIDVEKLLSMYETHSDAEIRKEFSISKNVLLKILERNNVIPHTGLENSQLTKLNRYGDSNYNNSEQSKKTNLERYGATTYVHSEKGTEEVKQIMLERYGVEHALQNPDLLAKMEATIAETGISYRFHTSEWDANMLEKYGTTIPYRNDDIKNKGITTLLEKYGVTNPNKLDFVKEKSKKTCLEKYGVEYSFQSENNKSKSKVTLQEKYGVDNACQLHKRTSNINMQMAKFFDISEEDMEFSIDPKIYDLKKNNILIEINPSATHSSSFTIYKDSKPKDELYHQNKTFHARKNGYDCINVWDWDDIEKIKFLLQDSIYTIGARECEVILVDKSTSDSFIDKYHIQGKCQGDKIRIGLVYNNLLVAVMTFGAPRYNSKFQIELLRLCYNSDYKVLGGTEKMFKFLLENFNPKSIISYCDLSKFSGKVYERLGFILKEIPYPSKHWYNIRTHKHITDNLLRQRGFDQLFGTNYGKGTSNEELMFENGFITIHDCGQATYIWEKENKKGSEA